MTTRSDNCLQEPYDILDNHFKNFHNHNIIITKLKSNNDGLLYCQVTPLESCDSLRSSKLLANSFVQHNKYTL